MDPYSYYRAIAYRQTKKFIQDVAKAIDGEYSAIQCYEKIAQMAQSANEKNQILEIRQDEINHFKEFSRIYTNLTGKQPTPKQVEDCPATYQEGLEFAFLDEQKTVDFYLEIASEATDPIMKETFKKAAADEQNHAVWFLYFMNKRR